MYMNWGVAGCEGDNIYMLKIGEKIGLWREIGRERAYWRVADS